MRHWSRHLWEHHRDSGPVVLQETERIISSCSFPDSSHGIPGSIGKDFHEDTGKPQIWEFYWSFAPIRGDLWHLGLPALHKMIHLYLVQKPSTQPSTSWAQMCTWTALPSWSSSIFMAKTAWHLQKRLCLWFFIWKMLCWWSTDSSGLRIVLNWFSTTKKDSMFFGIRPFGPQCDARNQKVVEKVLNPLLLSWDLCLGLEQENPNYSFL